jgi:hypothetical protein
MKRGNMIRKRKKYANLDATKILWTGHGDCLASLLHHPRRLEEADGSHTSLVR